MCEKIFSKRAKFFEHFEAVFYSFWLRRLVMILF